MVVLVVVWLVENEVEVVVEVEVDEVVVANVPVVVVVKLGVVAWITIPANAGALVAMMATEPAATAMIMKSISDCFSNLLHQPPKDRGGEQYEHREKTKPVNSRLKAGRLDNLTQRVGNDSREGCEDGSSGYKGRTSKGGCRSGR